MHTHTFTHPHTDGQPLIRVKDRCQQKKDKREAKQKGEDTGREREMSGNWQAADDCMKNLHLSVSDPHTHTQIPSTHTCIAEISIVNVYRSAV